MKRKVYKVVKPIGIYSRGVLICRLMNVEFTYGRSSLSGVTGNMFNILNPTGGPAIVIHNYDGFSSFGSNSPTTDSLDDLLAEGSIEIIREEE